MSTTTTACHATTSLCTRRNNTTNIADDNANIIFGSVVDQSMSDEVRVTVIATGFEGFELLARSPQRVRRRYEAKPRIAADDTDIRKLRVSDDDIDVPGFLKD